VGQGFQPADPSMSNNSQPGPRTAFEDKYLAEAKRICLAAVPDPRYEIFLFGSRAKGHCDHSSDVDIGIAGPEPLPDGVSRLMNLLIDSDVPWRCQVVDFALVTDEKFRRHAFEGRELWRAAN
jgi:predicted nucleotidyltransferase